MTRRIVAIANGAGSAGKTTSAVTLATLLGEQGQKVLVLDADRQCNATHWFGVDPDSASPTLGEVLKREAMLDEATLETNATRVWLVPGTREMEKIDVYLVMQRAGEQRLRLALQAGGRDFDVVIIDCPGSLSTVTSSALIAADVVLTVAMPTTKETRGVPELEGVIMDIADAYQPELQLGGIIMCSVPPVTAGQLYAQAGEMLRDAYGGLVSPPVRRTTRVPEAEALRTPLPVHAPKARVTEDYRDVLAWLQSRGVL